MSEAKQDAGVGDIDGQPLRGIVPYKRPEPVSEPVSKLAPACEFSVKEGQDRVCRYHPPQSTFLAVPGMQPGPLGRPVQGIAIRPFCGFPIVRDDQWCGQYRKRGM